MGPLLLHNSQVIQQKKRKERAVHRSTYHTTQRQIVRAPTSASCASAASPAAALFAAASAEAVDCSSPCGRRRVKSRPLAAFGNLSRPLRFHGAVPVARQDTLGTAVSASHTAPPPHTTPRNKSGFCQPALAACQPITFSTFAIRELTAGRAEISGPQRAVQLMESIGRPKRESTRTIRRVVALALHTPFHICNRVAHP